MSIADEELAYLELLAAQAADTVLELEEVGGRLEAADMWGLKCADSVQMERLGKGLASIGMLLAPRVADLVAEVRRMRGELARTDLITWENHEAACEEYVRQIKADNEVLRALLRRAQHLVEWGSDGRRLHADIVAALPEES